MSTSAPENCFISCSTSSITAEDDEFVFKYEVSIGSLIDEICEDDDESKLLDLNELVGAILQGEFVCCSPEIWLTVNCKVDYLKVM